MNQIFKLGFEEHVSDFQNLITKFGVQMMIYF